jgi:hypothetical protein
MPGMRIRRLLVAAALTAASATVAVGVPAANACTGAPCDVACAVANSSVGRKLGLLCPA